MSILAKFVLPAALAALLSAQPTPHRMEITLERQEAGEWNIVEPGLVFQPGDRLRFRFQPNFSGFLYVMNQGTSGSYELLFPREETGQNNRVEHGREYQIPATGAWFRVDGPPGHDIVYWLVTPVQLAGEDTAPLYKPLPPPPAGPAPPGNLLPRCDDSIFRARGVCVDSRAGPRPVDDNSPLPENLAGAPRLHSRELVIMKKGEKSQVSAPAEAQAPVLYQFRIAHE